MVLIQIWKILKRTWPKSETSLPVAMKNYKGKIVSAYKDIKNLFAMEYKNCLRTGPMSPDLLALRRRRQKIFEMKLKLGQ